MKEIERRQTLTASRLDQIKGLLEDAHSLLADKACVYATGSFGRYEASEFSDLDVFIVGRSPKNKDGTYKNSSELSRLDEICIKADLIDATRKLKIQDFDGDGRYLVHHSIRDLTATLGTPEDDINNTFTARLLMLLEGRPILGEAAYNDLTSEVIAAYWRDYGDHKTDFVPAFLANDVLRLWRTFCVNYEARTEREPEERKAKGKLKNYKLKHSRLLTCYSALLYIMIIFQRHGTVSPSDMTEMIKFTPLERLGWILSQSDTAPAHAHIEQLLEQYDMFLQKTNEPEPNLILKFSDKDMTNSMVGDTYAFGETMYHAIEKLGDGSRLH